MSHRGVRSLVRQQPPLAPDAATVPREVAIAPDDPVAWNHEADGISRVRSPDRANRARTAYDLGESSVGQRRPGWYRSQGLPDLLLKDRAPAVNGDAVEGVQISREIRMQSCRMIVGMATSLQDDARKSRTDPCQHLGPFASKGECTEGIVSRDDRQRSERRPNMIDPERDQRYGATPPEARRVPSRWAAGSHKSMAA